MISRILSSGFVGIFLVMWPGTHPLGAQPSSGAEASPEVAAEALFVEGKRLMANGEYEQACAKFRESQRLDSAVGTLMNLGLCYKSLGRTASAWSTYRQAASMAAAKNQATRERVARREAQNLEAQLSTVEVRTPTDLDADVRVTLDGMPMGAELLAVPTPVDPGSHEVRVVRRGRTVWSAELGVGPAERKVVSIPKAALEQGEPARPDSPPWTGLHTAAVVHAGVGLVAAGIGTALMLSARSDDEKASDDCYDDTWCDSRGFDLRERAIEKRKLATVSFAVSGASFVGAGVLWFSAPSLKSKSGTTNASSAWSVGYSGSW